MNVEPTAVPLSHALVSLYGAVAAVLRHDHLAVDLMTADLVDAFGDVTETLMAISSATLERLEVALGCGMPFGEESGCTARRVLSLATDYDLADERAVHAAAWRLDAVRTGDLERAAADVTSSQVLGSDIELVHGAVALLTAIVAIWALRTGRSARVAASELCLAAAVVVATAP